MSRISSGIPIYAMTRQVQTRRKVTLFRGVYPVSFDVASTNIHEVNREVIEELLRRGTVVEGDLVIITKGDRGGVEGTDQHHEDHARRRAQAAGRRLKRAVQPSPIPHPFNLFP
jgi:pyruvate kinase